MHFNVKKLTKSTEFFDVKRMFQHILLNLINAKRPYK